MNVFTALVSMVKEAFRKVIPYRSIEQAERVESSISTEMADELDKWHEMYLDKAPWLRDYTVKSLNLPAFIASEIARQIVLEAKVTITGKAGKDGTAGTDNPRSIYLTNELEKLMSVLRQRLEQGCAAGGMVIRPYPNLQDGHIYFDFMMDWEIVPISFDDSGNLSDVILPSSFVDGNTVYTRLERHQLTDDGHDHITQRAFKAQMKDNIGTEISMDEVPRWRGAATDYTTQAEGLQFGWFRVASANTIDVDSPMGASVFAKATKTIEEADRQYSRLLWEYEASEMAIHADPSMFRKRYSGEGMELPSGKERLYRAVDIDKGDHDLFEVFAPDIRDGNLVNGLNQILCKIEDLVGLSRGTISDANVDARTATELKIVRQRSFATVADNQKALERCLRDVLKAMDGISTEYGLEPSGGEWDAAFEWDDSILTDRDTENANWLSLLNAGIVSRAEYRAWYFGETIEQAEAAIQEIENAALEQQRAQIELSLANKELDEGPVV